MDFQRITACIVIVSSILCAVYFSCLSDFHAQKDINISRLNNAVPVLLNLPVKYQTNSNIPYKNHVVNGHIFEGNTHNNPVTLKHRSSVNSGEIQASLHLARKMRTEGKSDTALKVYEHALALDPSHPDLLNEYGEFLEATQKDVVLAEHMYCRALIISPQHTKALSNRERTLPLVEEIDQSTFNRLDAKRESLQKIPDSHPGFRRMKKESYFRHIHHTTAIEGNTFSLMETRSFVETRMVVAGKSIIEHNEILGMDAAYQFVNSSLVHRIGEITVQDILHIHKHVLGFVDPIGAGQFRTTQVFVGDHIPPAANEVEKLVYEFIDWLNSADALKLHPIELAALAHYRLVFIHPFYDGNGRSSRLLMNLIFMQAGYPPIIIHKEEKLFYYQCLQTANAGDVRPFIRFITRCTERTLDEYVWATSETPTGQFPSLVPPADSNRVIIVGSQDEGIAHNQFSDTHSHMHSKPYS